MIGERLTPGVSVRTGRSCDILQRNVGVTGWALLLQAEGGRGGVRGRGHSALKFSGKSFGFCLQVIMRSGQESLYDDSENKWHIFGWAKQLFSI